MLKTNKEGNRVKGDMMKFIHEVSQLVNHSFRHKVILFFLLIVLITFSSSTVFFCVSIYNILQENFCSEIIANNEKTAQLLDIEFENLNNSFYNIIADRGFAALLKDYENLLRTKGKNSYQALISKNEIIEVIIKTTFFNYSWSRRSIDGIFLLIGDEVIDISRIAMTPTLRKEINSINERIIAGKASTIDVYPEYSQRIYFVKEINSLLDSTHVASFIVQLSPEHFHEFYDFAIQEDDSSLAVLQNSKGNILMACGNEALLSRNAASLAQVHTSPETQTMWMDGKQYLVSVSTVANFGLQSVILIPVQRIWDRIIAQMVNYGVMLLVVLCVSIAISLLFSNYSMRHIREITKSAEEICRGNYTRRLPDYDEIEFKKMATAFNTMEAQIDQLVNEIYKKQLLFKESQLNALQAQINPHFLFNTLMCIAIKAKEYGVDTLYKMVISLSQLLKSNIFSNPTSDKITFAEELENVEIYLFLQNQRFDGKIRYEIDINKDIVQRCVLPRLCLQPVVENAVVHGFELQDNEKDCFLVISTVEWDGNLLISIEDNGLGFDTSGKLPTQGGSDSIGLSNTDQRIKLLYGEKYGISISSQLGVGTKVTIHIPKEYGGNTDV